MKNRRASHRQKRHCHSQSIPNPAQESLTSYGGIPLVVKGFRALGVGESVGRKVKIKERERGFDEATMVESFIILNACGGDYLDDFDHLREDEWPAELIGHKLPSASAARIAFNSLPESVTEYCYRGDSACHESELINWLNDDQREGGVKGKIGFAISAWLSKALRETIINGVQEKQWRKYGDEAR